MFDTIIVGAGSAGCVLANRLSADPARKVLLLEAGREAPLASDVPSDWPTMFNTAVDWGYYTEPQVGCRGRRVFWPRGKMIGGSGALNAMIYIRGLPSDYDGWAAMGCPGWAWSDVLPVFKACESNAELGNDPLHGANGPLHIGNVGHVDPNELAWIEACKAAGYQHNRDFNGVEQEGVGLFQFTIKNGERWGTGKAYLRPARQRPNLTVKTGVLATGLIVEKGRAKGIRYLVNGVPETAFAESEVVLSSGSIGSCQLMLLSGIGPADELRSVGVDPVHDLPGVGKDLQDHINIPITFYTKDKIGVGAWTDETLQRDFAEWQTSRSGPRSSPWVAAGGFVRSRPDVEPDLQLYGAISPHRDYVRFLSSKPGITLHTTLQRPDSRGEIRLRSANPIEYPAIDPRYFASDEDGSDIATLVEGIRISRRIAAESPLKEMLVGEITPSAECESDAEIAEYIRGHCTTLYHPTSTCRMGTDAMAVVDPASMKVHGLDGLCIADASVFPKMVSGNTNAPTIMIAERAASMILGG
ncbi:GMC family oxidoreductase N-terminal domain-containing protein [Mesorhizobium mediterraneum]|uniref:Alcohol dehydrogenase n=1 Tax=Mesorhizobium mediterraneum TaxID=43617 RepID=A0AB36RII9_9HYPH|nr:GMC family oxidoreductase N-terminal domain-containing protein [Mesorhizobium mediterraneum]PAQ04136.1 alcohol dehydrogenase [Mesorhizobium mediterraneum]RUU38059.1 alcohol dehydrogenase [Mesorhizobium sp. M6A.T.Ca.TU.002.02.2.1]RWN39333.1 MAG: alcohol dehydrogenase [Mesorhizobium sp.]WIW56521.1 GMC family oxidoreductase N-terminal domain-containing protein [Mesorhizobium mediterraneum]